MHWWLLLTGFLSGPALALSEAQTTVPLEPFSSPYLIKLTGGLIVVVVMIFLLAWLVRKFNLNQTAQNDLIKVVAGLSLGSRDRLVLVQVGDEQVLLGITPGRIAKLHTLPVALAATQTPSPVASFSTKLNQMMAIRKP